MTSSMGYIFESEIETIMNTVRARTIGEADSITLRDVLAADIHAAIKAYFKAEVEKLLQQERAKEVRSKRFSYGLLEVMGLQRQIDLLLVNYYEFDRQEFESLLDEAVHFEFNFLCRPQWTLQEFMCENRRTVGVGDAIRKFKYCVEYTYYAEIFQRYVVDRGLAEMSYEEFKKLIAKVDSEIVSRHSSTELAKMLRPVLEFIEVGIPETRVSETGPVIPINAAIVFFEDKNMHDIQKQLEEERDKKGKRDISLNDLGRVIATVKRDDEKPPEMEIPRPAREDVVEPVRAEKPARTEAGERQPQPELKEPRVSAKKITVAFSPLEDVYSLFSLKEQKLFVKKLFRKDEVEFRNALDRLNPVVTWKEASLVLDEMFTANGVDPFSKEAIQLTDKLYSRYAAVGQEKG